MFKLWAVVGGCADGGWVLVLLAIDRAYQLCE